MAKNMMLVTGEEEFLDNAKLQARLLWKRHFLKALMKSPGDPTLAIFRIPKGEAWLWSMAENMRAAETPGIEF